MASKRPIILNRFNGVRIVSLAVCTLMLPAAASAANNCPWLNEATASGLLGGEALGELIAGQAGHPAVCTFTQQANGGARTLRITVAQIADAQAQFTAMSQGCRTDAFPLKAIGNEASACSADDRKGSMSERVVGRVRDQLFTIEIATTLKNDAILSREALKSRIYTAAEQVAGNLY